MIELFYKHLAIPDACHLGKRVYKKLFYENTQLNAADKKAFSHDIEEIIWVYTLKPETINISKYTDEDREYDEVAFVQVNIKDFSRYKRISQIIQRAIPYPVLIIFLCGAGLALCVAEKRVNRADRSKITIEDIHYTERINLEALNAYEREFLDKCNIRNFSFNNFYEFYGDLTDAIVALSCAGLTGNYSLKAKSAGIDRKQVLNEIQMLQQEHEKIKGLLKKEKNLGTKVQLNTQIKQITERVEAIKAGL